MLRAVGLDHRVAGPVAAPRAAHRLGEELVRPLRSPLVGQVERDVRGHDAHQRHLRDVEPLRDEAGPDEDVRPPGRETVEDALGGALALRDVPIQPRHPEAREPLPDLALHPLRPASEVADARRRAHGAPAGDRPRASAVVAAQRRPGLVVDQGALSETRRISFFQTSIFFICRRGPGQYRV